MHHGGGSIGDTTRLLSEGPPDAIQFPGAYAATNAAVNTATDRKDSEMVTEVQRVMQSLQSAAHLRQDPRLCVVGGCT